MDLPKMSFDSEFRHCPKRRGNKKQRSRFMVTSVLRGSKIVLIGLLNEFLKSRRAVRGLYEVVAAESSFLFLSLTNVVKLNISD